MLAGFANLGRWDTSLLRWVVWDGSLTTGALTIGKVKITDGTTDASVRDLAANDALNVAVVDGSGNQITSFSAQTAISSVNSTTTALGVGGVFTGTFEDLSLYTTVTVSAHVTGNVPSAANGLEVQFSDDATNIRHIYYGQATTWGVGSDTSGIVRVPVIARYVRVKYTNGGTTQVGQQFALKTTYSGDSAAPPWTASGNDLSSTATIKMAPLSLPMMGAVAIGFCRDTGLIQPLSLTSTQNLKVQLMKNADTILNSTTSGDLIVLPWQKAGTSAVTSVADNAASVTLLSANTNRRGATITNDSSAALYVKYGITASTTDYTVRLTQNAYHEVVFGYNGRIDGIWASDPNDGAARITELTE